MQLFRIIYCSLTATHVSSDIFAHHQEHLNCIYSFWVYSRVSLSAAVMAEQELQFIISHDSSRLRHMRINPETVKTVKMPLIMSENVARNMWSSQGTINYVKQLHLFGHFCKKIISNSPVVTKLLLRYFVQQCYLSSLLTQKYCI